MRTGARTSTTLQSTRSAKELVGTASSGKVRRRRGYAYRADWYIPGKDAGRPRDFCFIYHLISALTAHRFSAVYSKSVVSQSHGRVPLPPPLQRCPPSVIYAIEIFFFEYPNQFCRGGRRLRSRGYEVYGSPLLRTQGRNFPRTPNFPRTLSRYIFFLPEVDSFPPYRTIHGGAHVAKET